MPLDAGRRPGVHIGCRAHLEADAPVPYEPGQPAQLDGPVLGDRDVVDDAHAVPQPLRAAPLDGLPDRRQGEGFSRMDGDVEVLASDVLERIEVARGRVASLGAGDVKANDALVAVTYGQL